MSAIVAFRTTSSSGWVANSLTEMWSGNRYNLPMVSEWLRQALEETGISQPAAAKHLTDTLHRPYDKSMVNKMTLGKRAIYANELIALEELTGRRAPRKNEDKFEEYVRQKIRGMTQDKRDFLQSILEGMDNLEAAKPRPSEPDAADERL